jgi:(R)-2-hydroxyacyl-CoA dehydratese activating ATPase
MMITAGIDAGTENMKVVILEDQRILSYALVPQGRGAVPSVAREALEEAARLAGVPLSGIDYMVATGIGREYIAFVQEKVSEASCCARGTSWLIPSTDTVIDIGADKCLVVKCCDGHLLQTARNDRCASGTGRFLKIAAKPLGIDVEEMGKLSLKSKKNVEINNNCAVFSESEIISLIHMKHRPEDISKAVFRGLASRIYTLIIKVDFKKDVIMVGGVAENTGMVKAMEEQVGYSVLVPEKPFIIGALGGALIAAQRGKRLLLSQGKRGL